MIQIDVVVACSAVLARDRQAFVDILLAVSSVVPRVTFAAILVHKIDAVSMVTWIGRALINIHYAVVTDISHCASAGVLSQCDAALRVRFRARGGVMARVGVAFVFVDRALHSEAIMGPTGSTDAAKGLVSIFVAGGIIVARC